MLAAIAWCVALGCAAAAPSPAGANLPSQQDGRIAYQRNDDAQGEIWVLDPAAASPESSAAKLTTDGAPEARPAWGPVFHGGSPQHLAFQRLQDGNWDLWDRSPLSGPATRIVAAPGNQVEPAYSDAITPLSGTPASGTALLAYISDETGTRQVWIRDGSGATIQLTTDGLGYANPEFGGRFHDVVGISTEHVDLAFESTKGGARAIWAMDLTVDVTTGALVADAAPRLVASGPGELSEPSWQVTKPAVPPLQRVVDVVFTTRESGTTYLDYVEEPLTGSLPFSGASQVARHQLTGDPGGDSGATWAPFGDRIAFTRATNDNPDLWVMTSDGANLRRLTERPGPDLAPSWQPGLESSADVVGGHTEPGPVTRTPKTSGGGVGGGGGAPGGGGGVVGGGGGGGGGGERGSPGLVLDRMRWHKRRVTVAGHAARELGGRVKVSFQCGSRSAPRTARLARVDAGRLRTELTAPRRCRRAQRAMVRAAYGGDDRYTAQTVKAGVRRR
jgi:uncharacterized membrane protein YgcG